MHTETENQIIVKNTAHGFADLHFLSLATDRKTSRGEHSPYLSCIHVTSEFTIATNGRIVHIIKSANLLGPGSYQIHKATKSSLTLAPSTHTLPNHYIDKINDWMQSATYHPEYYTITHKQDPSYLAHAIAHHTDYIANVEYLIQLPPDIYRIGSSQGKIHIDSETKHIILAPLRSFSDPECSITQGAKK